MTEYTVNLPDIGEGVVEGEVVLWLKQVGDFVAADEPVVVVMTDKATVELPSPYAGILAKQHFKQGEIALKDKPLYTIETESTLPKKVLATPKTRHLAKEKGIDLTTVQGTGKEGRVLTEDLEKGTALIGIPRLMAEKMAESKRIIPHFSYMEQVDATGLLQLKEKGEKKGVHATFTPFFLRALSLTAAKFPIVNSSFLDGKILFHPSHNIGIAMSTPLGLIVPVLKGVEKLTLKALVEAYEDLKEKASHNKLSSKDMQEGTVTLSNLGGIGGRGVFATPIINYPEVSILALSKIQKAPFVRNDAIVIRDVLSLSWSFDHRVIDGHQAASISAFFSDLIHNPVKLL